MTDRQLATRRTVDEVHLIPGADNIVEAVIDGWSVVVKKGDMAPGDEVVYFEIDSMLPINDPRFTFLAERGVRDRPDGSLAHRLKTVRLRGVISQGLAIPVTEFSRDELTGDIAEKLGVTKYEPPTKGVWLPGRQPDAYGPFPQHLALKTDSERVQNLKKYWDEIRARDWFATEKIDGTSLTVARDLDGRLIIASRNWEQDPEADTVYRRAVEKFGLAALVSEGQVVQGEIFGPGVQGNPLDRNELDFRAFSFAHRGAYYPRTLWPTQLRELAVPVVPFVLPDSVADAVAQVDGLRSLISPSRLAEGVVWHEMNGSPLRALQYRTTFKAISNSYLLKDKS